MADPYVTFAPAEVGPCTATWFVGSDTGSNNELPVFGPATELRPVGAWDYLVDGPLKTVLTAQYASLDAFMQAWATAGGEVSIIGVANLVGAALTGVAPVPVGISEGYPSKIAFIISADEGQAAPFRWVVKFSVPHSIIR